MGARQRHPVVVGDYEGGQLKTVPVDCPGRGSQEACDVVVHSRRPRKTGPGHALAVCRCHVHGLSFTVYPTGYAPYGRRDLVSDIDAVLDCVADDREADPIQPVLTVKADKVTAEAVRAGTTVRRLLGVLNPDRTRAGVALHVGLPITLMEVGASARGLLNQIRSTADMLLMLRTRGVNLLDALLSGGFRTGLWGPVHWLCPRDGGLMAQLPPPWARRFDPRLRGEDGASTISSKMPTVRCEVGQRPTSVAA